MKKKFFIISIIAILMLSVLESCVFADSNLKINITTSNPNAKVDDLIEVFVDWKEEVSSADFVVNYDSTILRFESADISSTYYNLNGDGKLIVSWFGAEETLSKMTFKFRVMDEGDASISVEPETFGQSKPDPNDPEKEIIDTISDVTSTPLVIENIVKRSEELKPTSTPETPSENNGSNDDNNSSNDGNDGSNDGNNDSNDGNNGGEGNSEDKKEPTQIGPIQNKNEEDKTLSSNKIPYAGKGFTVLLAMTTVGIVALILSIKLRNLRDVE